MRKYLKLLYIIFLLMPLSLTVCGVSEDDSLRYEILLSSKMLKAVKMAPEFIPSLEITPERHLLLSSGNQFYLLGWGGFTPLGKPVAQGTIKSFAYTADSLLLIVKDNELCSFNAKGALDGLIKLPGSDMAICQGNEVMYLYDRSTTRTGKGVYVLARGGEYAILFEVDSPVTAVAEMNNSLLFASGNKLCRFDIKTKELEVLATLEEGKKIISLAVDRSSDRIFFSTDEQIYSINKTSAATISEGIGGILGFYDGGLLIFDPAKKFLVRVAGIENELKNAKPADAPVVNKAEQTVLKNANIISLAKSGTSDALIISIIKKSRVDFNLSVDSMVELSESGVSSQVIMEMRQAMKMQTAESSGK